MKSEKRAIVGIWAVLGLAAVMFGVEAARAQPAANRRMFADSVTPLPAESGLTAHGFMVQAAVPERMNEKMDLLFSLAIPAAAQKELEAAVAKGKVLPRESLRADYSPKQEDVDALTKHLKDEGFEVTKITPDRTSVYARATPAQIEKTLQVQMVGVFRDGVTYTSARNAPSLPSEASSGVRAIIGLQPYRHMNRHDRKVAIRGGNRASRMMPGVSAHAAVAGPSTNIANAPPYLVQEILKAYNADGLGVNGAGEKIAILIDTFPTDSDLQGFWAQNSLSVTLSQIEEINVKGGQLPGQEGEETLDVEWASGIAPGAVVRVYASGSLQFVDLDLALDNIIADLPAQPAIHQLSISLGLGETFLGGPQGEVATQHQKFLQLAAAGVNVFVSSGDAGSHPDNTGHNPTGPLQAEYESSDPVVIGVGGTSLTLNNGGNVTSEIGWTAGGGGISIFFDRPAWQTGPGVPAGTKRLVPDVSLVADPQTGALIFFQGQVQQIGGTSWSAPTWAGFCALMNSARSQAGKQPLGFLNPMIYPLIGTSSFRDITVGSNDNKLPSTQYNAGPGYDLVTGIGVPNIQALINALP
jgi:kumamolisin